MTRQRHYWGFRIDTDCSEYPKYYDDELKRRVLRQGWGGKDKQNLRLLSKPGVSVPKNQKPNLRMYEEVKKGDIILIPRIPQWQFVTIAEATEDWKKGYKFEVDQKKGDYGHQFPAKYRTHFRRENKHVRSDIRSTLHCHWRFWNMNGKSKSIDRLLGKKTSDLT